jgi:hypothetical protein
VNLLPRESRDRPRERRQYPRTRIAWPVLIEEGRRQHPCRAVDISTQGAKVAPRIWLQSGTEVRLQFAPLDREPFRVGALVWRIDDDGLALLFARTISHPVIRS